MDKGKKKVSTKRESLDADNLFGRPNAITLPEESPEGLGKRQILKKLITKLWDTTQEWAIAWKAGYSYFEKLIPHIMKMKSSHEYSYVAHNLSSDLLKELDIMKHCSTVLLKLHNDIKKLLSRSNPYSLFSTLNTDDFLKMTKFIVDAYSKETKLKESSCTPLSDMSASTNTLNASLARWAYHSHLTSTVTFNTQILIHAINVTKLP